MNQSVGTHVHAKDTPANRDTANFDHSLDILTTEAKSKARKERPVTIVHDGYSKRDSAHDLSVKLSPHLCNLPG